MLLRRGANLVGYRVGFSAYTATVAVDLSMPAKFQILLRAVLLVGVACSLNGQILFGPKRATPKPAPPKLAAPKPMRKASELISKQEPVKINTSLIKQITPDTVRIVVS